MPKHTPDAARLAYRRGEQLKLLCRQATRSPFAIVIACAFVAYVVWGRAPAGLVAGWVALLCVVLYLRRGYALGVLANPPEDSRWALSIMTWYAFANGLATGIAAPLFFGALSYDGRALLTMILVCWAAGGVATAAAWARAFYAYVAPALLPIAGLWAATGVTENIVLAVLIVLFGLIQVYFVRDNERVVRDSFAIRYENERLVDELEREHQEVVLARDRAEEASRSKSRFLAAASHDLRQPLQAVALFGAALKSRVTDPRAREIAGQLDKGIGSLLTLLGSLLDVSKLDAGAVTPRSEHFDVKGLIESLAEEYRPLARRKGLEFRAVPAEAKVVTDRLLLERIVRNLVDNAVKHTREGTVTLEAQRDGRQVRIAVRDTGPGIPASERERIFDEFYQIGNTERDRSEGLGLGLSIVRRLARLLDLALEVDSVEGRGSTFAVRLPLAAATAPQAEPKAAGAAMPEEGRRRPLDGVSVLVIDDDQAVRLSLRMLLETLGCRVTTCTGLDDALETISRTESPVELIVADFRLRRGESGTETVQQLRALLGDIPALLLTGDIAPERLREAQAGGLSIVHKPVTGDQLSEAMRMALAR